MVLPDTLVGCSDVNYNMETMKGSQFKHDIPRAYMHISYRMNKISIAVETYSEIVR